MPDSTAQGGYLFDSRSFLLLVVGAEALIAVEEPLFELLQQAHPYLKGVAGVVT